ncbi:MAG: response regulator, partial [Pseudobdellovibrionaceae bacterium]|nr:response regulator [Pseudobdellovibrionaceae bacterium]
NTLKAGMRILVADDNTVNQKVAKRLLTHIGVSVDVVADGREALLASDSLNYDLILMDCQMPVLDGYEATRAIRARANGRRVPIIAMTADALPEGRARCLASGMDDYLVKPVQLEDLRLVLHRFLAQGKDLAPTAELEVQAELPLIDLSVIASLRELAADGEVHDEFIVELITAFLETAPRLIKQISEVVKSSDSRTLVHLAHKLKGSSRNLGLCRITAICDQLEAEGGVGCASDAKVLLQPLLDQFNAAQNALLERWGKNSNLSA